MPESVVPMLARSGGLPRDQAGWAFEIKWDGVRAIAFSSGGRLRLTSRSGRDITAQYPEVRGLADALGSTEAVLDGEVVAFGDDGRPSFSVLQRRMHVANERTVARLARDSPVAYVVFDVLWLDGHSLMDRPYEERRAVLAGLGLRGDHWQTPAHHVGDGDALLAASRAQGLEGIVAKRLDCPYTPGRRSQGWIKVKNVRRVSLVIGAWLPGEGGRSGRLGALAIGWYDDDGALHYGGRVGSGFTEAELTRVGRLLAPLARDASPFNESELLRLGKLLAPLAADASPFEGRQPPKQARPVRPELVCEVEFVEWTHTRTLRAPSYKGLRDDLAPEQAGFDPGA
jgi:bifunctional non-homologous end joining protein LigD